MGHRRGHPHLLLVTMVDGPFAGELHHAKSEARLRTGSIATVQRSADFTYHEVEIVDGGSGHCRHGKARWLRQSGAYAPPDFPSIRR